MIQRKTRHDFAFAGFGVGCTALLIAGCQAHSSSDQVPLPHPVTMTIAVGPAMNLSGSTEFDPVAVGDIMASELTRLGGVRVVGVNRVLAMMAELGLRELRSPGDALEIAKRLGVDGMVVFAITEYDPYSPPVVGMAAQLYAAEGMSREGHYDPVSASRSATAMAAATSSPQWTPAAEVQRVFDGADDQTVADLRSFALLRRADKSPYAWRKYLVSQHHFLRFCCSSVANDLMGQARLVPGSTGTSIAPDEERMP